MFIWLTPRYAISKPYIIFPIVQVCGMVRYAVANTPYFLAFAVYLIHIPN
ncbi:hypothetical protein [Aphanizomenon sp. UHCC 0183]|jgi:hypothetical protein|nr:hypothetical protein [Aphanizomenon sp. UHCC 0183]